MVCYGARVSTTAVVAGIAAYVLWHAAIGHIIRVAGLVAGIMLMACAAAVVAVLVARSARAVQRRRAAAGACTTCRFSCRQALTVPVAVAAHDEPVEPVQPVLQPGSVGAARP